MTELTSPPETGSRPIMLAEPTKYFLSKISYDPNTGMFTRLASRRSQFIGKPIQRLSNGYIRFSVNREQHYAHRIAWFLVHGEWPLGYIDHVNRVKTDNRITNLRLATPTENCLNKRHDGPLLRGVRKTQSGRFEARGKIHRKNIHFGTFDTEEQAHEAWKVSMISIMGKSALYCQEIGG